jgi:hypothetical protein
MEGRWLDSEENYIEFRTENEHLYCLYSLPYPSNADHYDYYRIIDGKYNLYVDDNVDDNVDCFKFTIKSKDTIEVYDYTDEKTYTMHRKS